jgi:hypothetical protein
MEEDEIYSDLDTLRYKHIALRNLQKVAILEIVALEERNVNLTNEIISLKSDVQRLSQSNVIANNLMTNALINNNSMKDDYRVAIQKLEKKIEELKNNE